MNWERIARLFLFFAAMITGLGSAWLFYDGNMASASAYMIVMAVLMWFAMRRHMIPDYDSSGGRGAKRANAAPDAVSSAALTEMAMIVADLGINNLKVIGRTVPPSTKEIEQLEGRLSLLLEHVGAPHDSREHLKEEFEKLKGRKRRNEGGMAILRSSRL